MGKSKPNGFSTVTIKKPDGSTTTRKIHPELADQAREILVRDLKNLNHLRTSRLIREPYHDLQEVQMTPLPDWQKPQIVAVMVYRISKDTCARIMLTQKQLEKESKDGKWAVAPKP